MRNKIIILFILVSFMVSSISWARRPPLPKLDPIHDVSLKGDVEEIKKILRETPEMLRHTSIEGLTPFHYAAVGGHITAVGFFLSREIDINEGEKSILSIVIERSRGEYCKKMVNFLLKNGANVNTGGLSPLAAAVDRNNIDVAEILLLNRTNINAKLDDSGTTALHLAASKDYLIDMLRFLILNGANINSVNSMSGSPLCEAAKWGNIESVELLLQHSANKNIRNRDGKTSLALAEEQLEKVIKHGGNTPNSIEKANNYRKIISLLQDN